MIFTKTNIVITLLLLSVSNVQAANVDFNAIYNKACQDDQMVQDCKNKNESNAECDLTKTKNEVAGDGTNTNKPCVNVKSDYVEPRFSTKRPRGQ